MKIAEATLEMKSSREFLSESEVTWTSAGSFRTVFAQVAEGASAQASNERKDELLWRIEKLIARLLELITGEADESCADSGHAVWAKGSAVLPDANDHPRQQVEMEWTSERRERIHERESTNYACTGRIKTADGCLLDFKLDLAMNREYEAERKASETGRSVLRDPLVINFNGKAAELSGQKLSFDLDVDGQCESIPGLGACSGYLAIDRNADGRINDGSELFGTRSGDGFADLALLDSDKNQWLDENDAAYDRLRIWRQQAEGEKTLFSLQEAGVGAIYLGSAETSFDLTDNDNRLLARVRASGIYLAENGNVGSVQQVDLAV